MNRRTYARLLSIWPQKSIQRRIIFPLFVIFGLALFYVWEQVTYNNLAMEAATLQGQRDRLFDLNQYLRAELDYKTGFDIIEKRARTELGMKFPEEGAVILVIPDNSITGTIKSTVKNFWQTLISLMEYEG